MPRTKAPLTNGGKSTLNRGAITKQKPKAKSTRKPSAASPQEEYSIKRWPPESSLYFKDCAVWDEKKFIGNIKSITFGSDFDIKDQHLDAIVATGPEVCQSICRFSCGDSDSGRGSSLSDASVSRLAAACPGLLHIDMDSARDLTDAALSAICQNCPNIEYISIDGNDKCKGHIGGTALDTLRADKKLAKELRVLHLVDQSSSLDKAVKALSKARKKLELTVGDTDKWGDGTIDKYRAGKVDVEFGGFGGFSRW
ncbi:hypothetical protein LSUE1_G004863 [Lachnellula suecica]|uniref:Uncharacterized protein n=1 Tax=Lachnellula suecica TaxID=602035 RepID=A0A8T9CD75_9HELO|nr:hypothetical protein LSUE1_G004863 [Lachnellula suecica]